MLFDFIRLFSKRIKRLTILLLKIIFHVDVLITILTNKMVNIIIFSLPAKNLLVRLKIYIIFMLIMIDSREGVSISSQIISYFSRYIIFLLPLLLYLFQLILMQRIYLFLVKKVTLTSWFLYLTVLRSLLSWNWLLYYFVILLVYCLIVYSIGWAGCRSL